MPGGNLEGLDRGDVVGGVEGLLVLAEEGAVFGAFSDDVEDGEGLGVEGALLFWTGGGVIPGGRDGGFVGGGGGGDGGRA